MHLSERFITRSHHEDAFGSEHRATAAEWHVDIPLVKFTNPKCMKQTFILRSLWVGWLLILAIYLAPQLMAQGLTIRGTVVDTKDEPIVGASVVVKKNPKQGGYDGRQGRLHPIGEYSVMPSSV